MNSLINGRMLSRKSAIIMSLIKTGAFHNRPSYFQKKREPTYYTSNEETLLLYRDASGYYNKGIDITTMGQHKKWRKNLVESLALANNSKVLDAAGGTGLTTLAFLEYSKKFNLDLNISVCDMNSQMMSVGQLNLKALNYDQSSVNWVECNVNAMPFEKETFDAFVITFGLRTCIDINLMLQEAFRILKPGGKIGIVDYCYSDKPTLAQWLHHKYIKYACGLIYQVRWKSGIGMFYLAENVALCPSKEKLTGLLENVGFRQIKCKPYFLGAAIQYLGQKPQDK